ncbi:Uncharacterised protein [Legionella steigerwaltii]|uniref:Uncharacterized protein n=1 Tax=Legionella steigerwaltii TaxID=460 RepID=A0A378L5P9_9GAMM|nr:hypothetical protein [Legionella steigerwaltii]KTD76099.1 hypothetical protein Lstg_2387 [Legionella steigerwaltii]STY22084.1 Uncharacterised protein [Legionella steigerwaltii]
MKEKKCTEFSYPPRTLNKPIIFITNSQKKDRGSSLYLVHENGTIRCSGSNEGKRKATTFIRPYLIGYTSSYKKDIFFYNATLGLSPFEGRAKNYHELIQIKKRGNGHQGNIITEIISFKDLTKLNFTPLTWQGPEKEGTAWGIARQEVLNAWSKISLKDYDFKREEHRVDLPESKKPGV